MLQMTYSNPRGFGGSAAVEEMQTALHNYAQATGNTAADPGKVDGIVGSKTVSAVAAVLPQVASTMSGGVGAILLIGLTAATVSTTAMTEAKAKVAQYASQITAAVKLAQVRVVGANNANSANVEIPSLDLMPGGVIFAFDPKIMAYRVAKPIGMQGLGAPT